MAKLIHHIVCPFCAKSSVPPKMSLKSCDPQSFGYVEVRKCAGARGFPTIEKKPLIQYIDQYKMYLDQVVDLSSGLLMALVQNRYPLHTPVFVEKYYGLIEEKKVLLQTIASKDLAIEGLQKQVRESSTMRREDNMRNVASSLQVSADRGVAEQWKAKAESFHHQLQECRMLNATYQRELMKYGYVFDSYGRFSRKT